ncbi:uncharacterized protein LOC115767772 [Drosophila novamexicana]|uniref:uncharacterized protein LOC115767772 n=1 Tax=Drosophila novamexicana TaxID=47314 RepID=UPI0011E5BD87|nr:uncharacterized protein LOC115767772 [Drosophila novamexicana]
MLKWAVNQPRPSYLAEQPVAGTDPSTGTIHQVISSYSDFQAAATPMRTAAPPTQRLKLKRQSLLPGLLHLGKENQLTSTPLPAAGAGAGVGARTPLLRDLSNIMSPLHTPMTMAMPTPMPTPTSKAKTAVYASTLPTFEAEYSPSYRVDQDGENNNNNNVIFPGALLALRGMGIPDSYFEKPRYLEQKPLPSDQVGAAPPPSSAAAAPVPSAEQTTLSSSQMGDVTLERMIDAILESTRKPPARVRARSRCHSRLRQRQRQRPQPQPQLQPGQRLISTSHSPTYRPAFDPASDLSEYWQPPVHPDAYEEREVCSPQPLSQSGSGLELELELAGGGGGGGGQGKRRSLQLRRQRVVRRKRQIATKISSSVRQSAQKLLAAASRSAQKLPHSQSRAKQRHISPDSGHNSTSDCELELDEEEDENLALGGPQLEGIWLQSEARDATKRRLSFSLNEQS